MINGQEAKITDYTDLVAWQRGHSLYVEIYKISKRFPKEKLFGITNQIKRASLSVTSNIAEGFGRKTDSDTVHFFYMSRGSLFEVINQLIALKDIELIDSKTYEKLREKAEDTKKVLIGLINSTNQRNYS